ncbi:4-hydroxy-3-methylbut-2-enyl diphosphate reductase [Pseudonocardia adelaidensis]|uniref:4-hydroxy-3-methylbut-2-enyl diphosphate reductase n=1 Tax=Pseudonocardia adelaidensis TaxID=648754 RepID=UPI0031F03212
MRPVLCTPLRVERAALRGTRVPVRRTGMGPRRADAAAASFRPGTPVLVAGLARGETPGMRAGDVVVATEVRGPGREPLPVPSAPLLAAALRRLGLTVHLGPVRSAPRLVGGPATGGALAADMESAWLAVGGPFAVVRVVVDSAEHPLARPGTPVRGLRALRALRACAPALEEWAAAVGPREVLLASPRSFCAGVERAIQTVERALEWHGPPVYVRRQIVHNAHVVRDLAARGAVFVEEVDEVPPGARLVLAAHGVAPGVRRDAAARGLTVVDATCPLVAKVHAEVRRQATRDHTVFLIGHPEHEEVEGTRGEAPDHVLVVPDVDTARRVRPRDPQRVSYAMQTTLAVDEAGEIADVLRARFPALTGPRTDDICYATTNRQQAVRGIAGDADLVLVVGSANSSNSRRLVEVAERAGTPAHLVDDPGQIDLRWLAGARRVGVTAGASAPPHLVGRVVTALSGLGPVTARESEAVAEDISFALPREED